MVTVTIALFAVCGPVFGEKIAKIHKSGRYNPTKPLDLLVAMC
jgi:hypothetical protein